MEAADLEGVARDVLSRAGVEAPVDAVALAHAMRVEVRSFPGHEPFVDLLRRCVYMPSRPVRRTRFCGDLLHEISHVALRDRRLDAHDEPSACYLAGALGVPRETLDRQLKRGWSLRRLRELHPNASNEMLARRIVQVRSAVATIIDGGEVTRRVASPWLEPKRVAPVRVWEMQLVQRALIEGEVDEGTTVAKHAGGDRVVIVTDRWSSCAVGEACGA